MLTSWSSRTNETLPMLEALQGSDGDREMGKWNIDTLIDVCTGAVCVWWGQRGVRRRVTQNEEFGLKTKTLGKRF